MALKIEHISIDYFLSFGPGNLIDLNDKGLVLINGINEISDVASSNGAGKCMTGSTKMFDPGTGEIRRLDTIVEGWTKGIKNISVLGLTDELKLVPVKVIDAFETGTKECIKITFDDGSAIELANTHPLLGTELKCRPAKNLSVGDYIAAPRDLRGRTLDQLTEDEISILAIYMAEGGLTSNSIKFSNTDKEIIEQAGKCLQNIFNIELSKCDATTWIAIRRKDTDIKSINQQILAELLRLNIDVKKLSNGNYGRILRLEHTLSWEKIIEIDKLYGSTKLIELIEKLYPARALTNFLESMGINNKLSTEKTIPDCVYQSSQACLSRFVADFWSCDGYISNVKGTRGGEISVTLSSEKLVDGLKVLLLKFGIHSRKRLKIIKGGTNKEKTFNAWVLNVNMNSANIIRFWEFCGEKLITRKRKRLELLVNSKKGIITNHNTDIIPAELSSNLILGERAATGKAFSNSELKLTYDRKQLKEHNMSREKLENYSINFNNSKMKNLSKSDLYWKKIIDIKDIGVQKTYDITIDSDNHLYATTDIITHNSSLQESLPWCLFGKTTKDVAADEVVNNLHKKDCAVKITFSDTDGAKYVISRYRKHAEHGDNLYFVKITAEGETGNLAGVDKADTQKRIEQFIGCSFTLFCNSAYFSQNNVKPFSTYTDKQLKEVFIDALDMTRFTRGVEQARLDLKTLREELATVQGRKLRIEEEIAEAQKRQKDYEEKHAGFDSQRAVDVAKIATDIREHQKKILALKAEIDKASIIESSINEYQKIVENLPIILDSKTSLATAATNFRNSFSLIIHKAKEAERLHAAKNNELRSIRSKIGTNCGECGKPIEEADLKDIVTAITAQLEAVSTEIGKFKGLLEKATPKVDEYQAQEADIEKQIADCRAAERSIADLKISLARIESTKREIEVLESNIRSLNLSKASRAAEESPWQAYIDKEQGLIDAAQVKIEALDRVIVIKQEEIQYVEYWETACGYAGIPSFLLDTVTPVLNERANHYSSIVTAGEIDIDFSTVTKTKKGELKDKFAINISHQHGAKAYKGISGGERKRADVCIAQAIQDLVRNFGRNPLAYCSYDEPFENLDTEGVSSVVEMLQEVSKEIGTVLVVTHNSELKAMFDNAITVVKGKDGYSRIV